MIEYKLQTRPLSSLAKVFPQRIFGKANRSALAARGQKVSFQIAYRLQVQGYRQRDYRVKVVSELEEGITLSRVGLVPAELPAYPTRCDANYLTQKSGLFPDPLYPLQDLTVCAAKGIWRSLWVCVDVREEATPKKYPITVEFYDPDGNLAAKQTYVIHVQKALLPPQKTLFTQWFYCDCIADVHGVEIYSEAHWSLIERYMKLAAEHGMSVILTPVVTPPLDTVVGGERPTVQLVEVEITQQGYAFDFSKLHRFVSLAKKYGIRQFEISHLFTQWGAKFAPKVVAWENGECRRIFGWETDASDPKYVAFLTQLIPQLIDAFAALGVEREQLWFHLSDEPHVDHLPQYRASKAVLYPLIEGCHHIDALSDYEFYKDGLVETPVVGTNYLEPFLEAEIHDLWCYTCCSQCVDVSNRFFAMPSARTRIIGVQMYRYGIKGFLQWGYNFYNTQLSKKRIDPYSVTDAGAAFPAGDAFSVYPYEDGAIPSLRQKVFANALEDIRLLELLEAKIGRVRTVEELDRLAGEPLTFKIYPRDEDFFQRLYQRVFALLEE